MTTETAVTRFVAAKDVVIPYKTLKTASEEANDYQFVRLGNGHYACVHGDNAYVIIEKMSPDRVPVIGCSCKAWTFGQDHDGCKHVATFHSRSSKPAAQVTSRVKLALLAAGWRESQEGNLYPPSEEQKTAEAAERQAEVDAAMDASWNQTHPETTSDEDGEDVEGDAIPEQQRNPKNTKPKQEEPKMDEEVIRVVDAAEALGAKDVAVDYIIEKLAKLKTFRVTGSEAESSVVSGILRVQGIKRPKGEGGHTANVLRTVESIDAADIWCNIRVKVTQLWDSDKDSIRQIGLVGDETGVVKFVSWEKANMVLIEVDKCYSIENVVTNEYEGVFSVAFTKNTTIAAIDEDIEVGFVTSEFAGVMVSIQEGSGLIKRCPICNRAMQKGTCAEHGNVEGTPDMRIKAVLDNGIATKNILLNRERTEGVTGITMDVATEMAREALDAGVVADTMRDMLVAKEYVVFGYDMGDTLLVESMNEIAMPVKIAEIEVFLEEV